MSFSKKYIFSFLILALLIISPSVYADEDLLKIGLYWGNSAKTDYSVSASSNLSVGYYSEKNFVAAISTNENYATICPDSSYHILYKQGITLGEAAELASNLCKKGISAFIRFSNGTYSVAADSFSTENDCAWAAENLAEKGTVLAIQPTDTVVKDKSGKIIFMSDTNCGIVSQNEKITLKASAEKEYRGGLTFYQSNSKLVAANIVNTEKYLYSVISKEMSPSWNKEALKAQAICARCFAYNNKNKHKKDGFELCDTVCCQAYAGTSSETKDSYAPVDETKGQYLLYNGKVCETFYCSSMGPTTENVKYVWGSEYPYLVSVDNSYEDYENVYNGKWQNTLTKQRATEIMQAKNYNVGDVTEIKALEYSPSGRVIKLLVKGTAGEKTFEKDSCRNIFSEVTPSQYYTISGGGEETVPVISVKSGENGETVKISLKNKKIISSNGTYSSGKTVYATNGTQKTPYTITKSQSSSYTFSGFGWGHGVGMSQYGAKAMADAGIDYKNILIHYFPGTQVGKPN